MNIRILSWRCIKHPEAGGSEQYFHEFAKRWVLSGHKVSWFSPIFSGGKKEEIMDGIYFIRRGGKLSVYIASCFYHLTHRDENLDVVIDVENGIPFFSPFYLKARSTVLHINHSHKDIWFKEKSFVVGLIGYFLESFLMPILYKKSQVITLSLSSCKDLLEEKKTSKPPLIVEPGVNFYTQVETPKTKNPTILFMNRIKKYKGIIILLESAKILKDMKRDDIEFLIAGKGDYLKKSREFAIKHNLTNVHFLGFVSEEAKRELFQKTWIFVNPSYKEGWGIINIEASHAGLPVIGANVPGIRDSVLANRTGLLFTPGNPGDLTEKIVSLVDDRTLSAKLAKEGKRWASQFSWDKKAEDYLSHLKKIIS